jgi:peptidoglycan/LPS O-acetylase OafA/YrhL
MQRQGKNVDTPVGSGTDFMTKRRGRWMFRHFDRLRAFLRSSITVEEGLARRQDNFLVLRIAAAAAVIYGHASAIAPSVGTRDIFVRLGWGIYSGDIAVNIFFLISGFLVTGSYIRQRSFYKFAKARILRVYPAFVLNVVLLATVYGLMFTSLPSAEYLHHGGVWNYIATNLKMSSNMVWTLPGVFEDGAKTAAINGAQWTLPAEVRMYVLLGILGAIGLFASVRVATLVLAVLFLAGLVHPELFPLNQTWLRLAGYFMLGVCIYLHRASIRVSLELVVVLVLAAVLVRHLPPYPMVFALALAGVVGFIAYLMPPWRWLERFGDPSYGIYLWGWPCQQAVAHIFPGAGLTLHVGSSLAMATVMGYGSWTLLEKQMLRLK